MAAAKSNPLPKRPKLMIQLAAGLVLPGLGHFLQGRKAHALLYAVIVLGLFITGMAISARTAIDPEVHDFLWLIQFLNGAPAWIVRWGGLAAEARIGDTVEVTQQSVGACYLAVGGLLNALSLAELVKHDPALKVSSPAASEGPNTGTQDAASVSGSQGQ